MSNYDINSNPALVKQIIENQKKPRKRTQNIHIQYDGIGFIPLDELLKEETA